ncbi:MAG TPA: SRPBCC domain-containing protein [Candidatus Stackebrandtia excrementipullorum]|nr:SRPBCC domain-containing protein [Candidatus Stackebrandtia excrementipullorum]
MRDNRLEKRVEFDATVGQVWEAVSTGHGMSSWFVPHDITPPVNETDLPTAEADFGSGNTDQGRVLTWDPPHMVRYGGEAHNPTEALEFFVEPKENGGTVLRLVQSGVLGEEWEMEYHAKGWDLFFHNLDSYFRHFAPNRATNALAMAFTTIDAHAVWDRYHTALGTDRNLRIGSPVNLTPEGVEPIRGEVDLYEADSTLGIRTDDGLYRFSGEGNRAWGMVNAFHYRYGTDVDAMEWTQTWQDWLASLFPSSETPPSRQSPEKPSLHRVGPVPRLRGPVLPRPR